MFKELFDVLPAYGQVLLTIGIVFVGIVMATLGFIGNIKKRESSSEADPRIIPMWLMMGPVHDAIQSVHEISRHIEAQTAILRDIDKTLTQIDHGQQYTHYVLEAILREQNLAAPPLSRDPHYRRG